MSLGVRAWPEKMPGEVLVVKEQWDKAKAKSTKSAQGRFVWNLGRSAMAAMIAFQLIPVDIVGGFMRLAFIAGFGLAAGFFGARAMLWSSLLIFLIAHRARSEEQLSELQSPRRSPDAVFCLTKKNI